MRAPHVETGLGALRRHRLRMVERRPRPVGEPGHALRAPARKATCRRGCRLIPNRRHTVAKASSPASAASTKRILSSTTWVSFHGIGKVLLTNTNDLSPMSPVRSVTHVAGLDPCLSLPRRERVDLPVYAGRRRAAAQAIRINDCQYCPLQHRCTSGKERRITRWEHEHLIDEMRQRLGRDPDPMTLRRCTVERPFGTIKAWMGATHFRMRRLKNVRTEMALHVLAYNIKRMISLVGVRRLLGAILS